MRVLLKRAAFLFFLPLAVLLLFAPFNLYQSKVLSQEIVVLHAVAAAAAPDEVEKLRDISAKEITGFPSLKRSLDAIAVPFQQQTIAAVPPAEWKTFSEMVCGADTDMVRFSYRDSVFQAKVLAGIRKLVEMAEGRGSFSVTLRRIERRVSREALRKLRAADLEVHPQILHALQDMETADSPGECLQTGINPEAWRKMTASLLNLPDGEAMFLFGDHVYAGRIKWKPLEERTNIPVVGVAMKILAVISLVFALLALKGLYKTGKEDQTDVIRISPRWVAMLWDGIAMCFVGLALYCCVDLVLAKVYQAAPMVDDDKLYFMSVFFIACGVPVLSLFTTATATQRVAISADAVVAGNALFGGSICWDDVQGVQVSNTYVRAKKVVRLLVIEGKNDSVTLMEPPLKSTKRAIITALLGCAPERLREQIEEVGAAW